MKFSFKIDGLDRLSRRLDDIQKAIARLEGEIAEVAVKRGDETSVTTAIAKVNAMIDGRLGPLKADPVVASIAEKMKATYAAGIRERAGL